MLHKLRVWDLPTRLFHWSLVATTIALVVSAKLGADAMQWHLRLGYVMLALLAFRLVWGFVGGYWSRFASFVYSPTRLLRYVSGRGQSDDDVGHSPLGALSVFTLLALLLAQVGSGLMSDDEISFAGPLARHVSGDWVNLASWYHKDVGQYLLLAFIALHLCAITFYTLVRHRPLVRAMLRGDKQWPSQERSARDDAKSRTWATLVLALAAALAWWVASLGE
ncbi:MAG: cytochrome b/b6 domain-containing protein [Proteobacteria bacterium]|nr:cytochrome b/b6 domain-containing protein [Pseudomonadota bacterium]